MLKNIKITLSLCLLVLSGCAQLPKQPTAQMGNLLIVEPIPANPRAQLAIVKINYDLGDDEIQDSARADLHYQRGLLYDSMGLSTLAQFDFTQVLVLRPNMAEAYNSIGIHYVQQQNFSQAYEAFDSSIDIKPDYDFAYLNRGIALYYGGKPELAIDDLAWFQQRKPTDPYRAIWRFIAAREVNEQEAIEQLRADRAAFDPTFWANNIVDFYLGDINENALLNSLLVNVENRTELNNRVCEAYFYIGKHHSYSGQRGKASNYFKLALSTNVYDFVEHRYARLELERLTDNRPES